MDIPTLFCVKNKVVLVTGGSRGIGLMIASGFVANGAKVYISARSKTVCDKTAAELTERGPGQCISLPADLQNLEDIKRLVRDLSSKESSANWGETLQSYPDSAFDKVLTLNVRRVFSLTQACLPLLTASASAEDPARVINIGSVDGIRVPALETYAYSTSKAALHHLSRVLANKLGENYVTVNAIAPGPFESKMMATTLDRFKDVIVSGIPMNRIGAPSDMAGVCLYLSSKAGAYVTGTVIPVDGGALIQARIRMADEHGALHIRFTAVDFFTTSARFRRARTLGAHLPLGNGWGNATSNHDDLLQHSCHNSRWFASELKTSGATVSSIVSAMPSSTTSPASSIPSKPPKKQLARRASRPLNNVVPPALSASELDQVYAKEAHVKTMLATASSKAAISSRLPAVAHPALQQRQHREENSNRTSIELSKQGLYEKTILANTRPSSAKQKQHMDSMHTFTSYRSLQGLHKTDAMLPPVSRHDTRLTALRYDSAFGSSQPLPSLSATMLSSFPPSFSGTFNRIASASSRNKRVGGNHSGSMTKNDLGASTSKYFIRVSEKYDRYSSLPSLCLHN